MRWTEDQLAEHQRRRKTQTVSVSATPPAPAASGRLALGRLKTGEMNKTEARYAEHLEQQKYAGEILWWKFEGIKLRLADNTFLTIDFPVMRADGLLEMREVKGFMQEDAAVKLKVAASMYPFRFLIVRKKGAGWDIKAVGE